MKVAELVAVLNECDPEADVVLMTFASPEECCCRLLVDVCRSDWLPGAGATAAGWAFPQDSRVPKSRKMKPAVALRPGAS